jgi:hypothetical protein
MFWILLQQSHPLWALFGKASAVFMTSWVTPSHSPDSGMSLSCWWEPRLPGFLGLPHAATASQLRVRLGQSHTICGDSAFLLAWLAGLKVASTDASSLLKAGMHRLHLQRSRPLRASHAGQGLVAVFSLPNSDHSVTLDCADRGLPLGTAVSLPQLSHPHAPTVLVVGR